MDVKLPNGAIIKGIPEGTSRDEVMQKAIAAGLATDQDFAATKGRNEAFTPTPAPMPKADRTIGQIIYDFATGKEGERGVFAAPELNEMSFRAFKSGLGGLLTGDPQEIQSIIAKNYPEAEFGEIDGQPSVRFPSGDYFLNPKGIDPLDIARFGTDVAAFTPAGGITGFTAKQLGKGALVAGGTQAGLQGVEAATGGTFDVEDIAIEAATQGAFQGVEAGARAIAPTVKEAGSKFMQVLRDKFKVDPKASDLKTIGSAASGSNAGKLIPQIMADPDVMRAAQELGVNVNPGVYSTSEVYREFERALKALPETRLEVNEKQAIDALRQRAQDMITEFGGYADPTELSRGFSEQMLSTVRSMEREASALYSSFDDIVPKSARLIPSKLSTLDYIKNQIDELGGIENLDPLLKQMYQAFSIEEGPTQALVDKFRRDVGAAIDNPMLFKDAGQAELKRLYGTLTDDTLILPTMLGLVDEVKAAKDLVRERKVLEEGLQVALGDDLSKSLMREMRGAVGEIAGGGNRRFNQIMEAVPEDMREQVVVTALNDVFSGGSAKAKDFSLGGFVTMYEALTKNKTYSDELFQYLPAEAKTRMDNIYLLSKGILDSNRKDLSNPSGTASKLIANMNSPDGVFTKLYNIGRQAGMGAAATSPFDAGMIGATAGVVNAIKSTRTRAAQAADEFLTSGALRDALNKYAQGDFGAANGILSSASAAAKWLESQPNSVKRAVARQGFIQYLAASEDE